VKVMAVDQTTTTTTRMPTTMTTPSNIVMTTVAPRNTTASQMQSGWRIVARGSNATEHVDWSGVHVRFDTIMGELMAGNTSVHSSIVGCRMVHSGQDYSATEAHYIGFMCTQKEIPEIVGVWVRHSFPQGLSAPIELQKYDGLSWETVASVPFVPANQMVALYTIATTAITTTTSSTMMTTTTAALAPCSGTPEVLFAKDVSMCAGSAHGSICAVSCKADHALSGDVVCDNGRWHVSAVCQLANAGSVADTVEVPVMVFSLEFAFGPESEFDYEWAQQNKDVLVAAFARALGVDKAQIIIEISGSQRRLQFLQASEQHSSGAFRVKATVALGPESSKTNADEVLRSFIGGNSSDASEGAQGFITALQDEFQERSMSGREGLSSMVVTATEAPRYIERFTLPVATWLVGTWSSCSRACGQSSSKRGLSCFAVDVESGSCEQQAGPQPLSEEMCEDYSSCPFEMMCPLGQGNKSFSCPAQSATVCGLVALPFLICLLCVVRCVRRKLRPPQKGQRFIAPVNAAVSFNVIRPQVDAEGNPIEAAKVDQDVEGGEDEGHPSRTMFGGPLRAEGDAKTRVVWNIDVEKVQEWFEAQRAKDNLSEDADTDAGHSISTGELSLCGENTNDSTPEDSQLQPVPLPAYVDGQIVEYYSNTNHQWTAGTVNVDVTTGNVLLNVRVGHGAQVRPAVPLNCLRPLFQGEALVEVFGHRNGEVQCFPAVVTPGQARAATLTGYQVQVDGTGEVLSNIPAARLRSRFPASSKVEVYRGQVVGWREARVHAEAASFDGCGAQDLPLPGKEEEAALEAIVLAVAGHSGSTPRAKPGKDMLALVESMQPATGSLWTHVPLCTAEGSPEWVPSYLLRTNNQANEVLIAPALH